MLLTVGDDALGTSEVEWTNCGRLKAAPPWALDDVRGHVAVIAPHPDDESLGLGGTLSMLARRGVVVTVVSVTDGEASHPRSRTTSPAALRALRAQERDAALAALGITTHAIRLSVPDGGVASSPDVVDALVRALAGATLCFAPYRRDGHPDHDAAGNAAATACTRLGLRMLEYPVWAWHWARPTSDDLPWPRVRRVELDAHARAAKTRAIRAYGSQIAPLSRLPGDEAVLPRTVVDRFLRPFEVVFT